MFVCWWRRGRGAHAREQIKERGEEGQEEGAGDQGKVKDTPKLSWLRLTTSLALFQAGTCVSKQSKP